VFDLAARPALQVVVLPQAPLDADRDRENAMVPASE
jgi:hypothetical protein